MLKQKKVWLIGCLALGTALAEPTNYNVSGQVIYEAKGPIGRFVGNNGEMGGTLTWDAVNNSVRGEVCVDLKTWKSGEPIRDDHTQTMFQVSKFPSACMSLKKLEGNPTTRHIVP